MPDPSDEYYRSLLPPDPDASARGVGRLLAAARRNPAELAKLLGVAALVLVGGAVLLGVVSLLNVWIVIGATLALAGLVAWRTYQQQQRAWWVEQGCCANCGYDLTRLPTRTCPECGRDSTLDEPTWRRLRREHEAKYGKVPQPVETHAASQLDEADIRQLLAKAQQRSMDV